MISGNRKVVGNSDDFLSASPDSFLVSNALGMAVEADINRYIRTMKFPRVSIIEPRVRRFKLRTIGGDQLLEDTVLVAEAVTPHGQLRACARIEVTGCETAKTAISQARVALAVYNECVLYQIFELSAG